MTSQPLLLHVGYHKTGTTFVQRQFFARHPGIRYLGKPWINEEVRDLFADFNFANALDFDADSFRSDFERIAVASMPGHRGDERPIVVSQESLHSGPEWFGMSTVTMAERLHATFPEAKILLTVRNQVAFIDSVYRNYILHGGRMSMRGFLYESYDFRCGLAPKLNYDRVVGLYSDLFGPDRVQVILHEDLKGDPEGEIRRICAFLGVEESDLGQRDENVGVGAWSIPLIRAMNQVLASDFAQEYYEIAAARPVGPRHRARRRVIQLFRRIARARGMGRSRPMLSEADEAYIRDRYADSNAALARRLGRDLVAEGYSPTAPAAGVPHPLAPAHA